MSLSDTFINGMRTLIRTLGTSASFSRTTGESFVPSTGAVSGGTTTTYSAHVVMINPGGDSELANNTTEQFDFTLWTEVNASNTVPIIGDIATVNNIAYRVLTVQSFIINSTDVLYKLLARI